jgi:L-iditol 2-dehydrogenase
MPETVGAAVLVEAGRVELRSLEMSSMGPRDVRIAPKIGGICGSDLTLFRRGRIGDSVMVRPLVLGHETAGVIVAVGAEVTTVAPGDRVVIEPGLSCGECRLCREGRYNLCPRVRFMGIPPTDGSLAESVVVPAVWVHRLPPELDWRAAAMIEPFAVGLMAVEQSGLAPGDDLVILGAGPIGLMILQAARLRSPNRIISIDISDRPLALASTFGAIAVNQRQDDALARVMELTDGRGADVVIEAVGSPQTISQSIQLAARGGSVTLVGVTSEPAVPLDTTRIVRTGITVRSSFRYANVHDLALRLAAQGQVDITSLITHEFAFPDVNSALPFINENKDEVIKGIIALP